MAKITKIQALTKTIQMWTFIAHGKGGKSAAMRELFPYETAKFSCFLCQQVPKNVDGDPVCKKCLVWGPRRCRCTDVDEAYYNYLAGYERESALEIVRLSQEALKRVRAEEAEKRRVAEERRAKL
jgi:hypothetical protein